MQRIFRSQARAAIAAMRDCLDEMDMRDECDASEVINKLMDVLEEPATE